MNNKISALDKIFLMLHSDYIESLDEKKQADCGSCLICDHKKSRRANVDIALCRCIRIGTSVNTCNKFLKELLAEIFEEFKT